MGDAFDAAAFRLEALESRQLLSGINADDYSPVLLNGSIPVVTDDFINPDQPDAVSLTPATGGVGNPDFDYDYANPNFDADYRDWTFELELTEIDGGAGKYGDELPLFGTVSGLPGNGYMTRSNFTQIPVVQDPIPQPPATKAIDWTGYISAPVKPGTQVAPVEAKNEQSSGMAPEAPIDQLRLLDEQVKTSLWQPTQTADKKDAAKVSLSSSFVSVKMPSSADLVLPTLL